MPAASQPPDPTKMKLNKKKQHHEHLLEARPQARYLSAPYNRPGGSLSPAPACVTGLVPTLPLLLWTRRGRRPLPLVAIASTIPTRGRGDVAVAAVVSSTGCCCPASIGARISAHHDCHPFQLRHDRAVAGTHGEANTMFGEESGRGTK